MTDWPRLIADLEAWKPGEPSRELADRVLVSWGCRVDIFNVIDEEGKPAVRETWYDPNDIAIAYHNRPNPLTSMDAAVAGVPDGWEWTMSNRVPKGYGGRGYLHNGQLHSDPRYKGFEDVAGNPAHALTIAVCKARAEMEG